MARIFYRLSNITNSHYRLSGSEPQIIFRSVVLGKKKKSDNSLRVISLRCLPSL